MGYIWIYIRIYLEEENIDNLGQNVGQNTNQAVFSKICLTNILFSCELSDEEPCLIQKCAN